MYSASSITFVCTANFDSVLFPSGTAIFTSLFSIAPERGLIILILDYAASGGEPEGIDGIAVVDHTRRTHDTSTASARNVRRTKPPIPRAAI